jgi:hypothetical protein
MVGITEISALMSSLKGAKELAESMIGLRDAAAVESKVFEFKNLVINAQNSAFAAQEERTALVEKVAELEKKIASLENWATEKKRYELKRVGYGGTAVVYELKPEMADGEPTHSVCANCYQNAEKSILQGDRRGGCDYLVCPRCKTSLITAGR